MRILFLGARLGNCLRHAINKLPGKLMAIASPVRKALRSQFHTLLYRARQRRGLRVFALGQRLRHLVEHVTATAGAANGERVRRWFRDKKAGWYAVLADPQMPVTSTLLDQAHKPTVSLVVTSAVVCTRCRRLPHCLRWGGMRQIKLNREATPHMGRWRRSGQCPRSAHLP